MLPFNTFSIHDLVGLMVSAPLAIMFYLIYARLGRRKLDLLFGNLLACSAAYCGIMFLVDNIVPAGTPASDVAHGPQRTLDLMRLAYALTLVTAVMLLHLVLRYCGRDRIGRLPVRWLYPVALLLMPIVWAPQCMKARTVPLGGTSSWRVAVPYLPEWDILIGALLLVWTAVSLYAVGLLWRYRARATGPVTGELTRTNLLLLAVTFPLMTAIMDVGGVFLAKTATVTFVPVGVTAMGALIATALLRGRVRAEREKEQFARERSLASEIQQGLLPKHPPTIEGFDIAGWSHPATETGGDNYDFMVLPDRHLMITLGDAAGHGMGPALMIAETRAVLRAFALSRNDPAVILRDAGELLVMDLPEDRLVTCFVGILDAASFALAYASAGQGPVFFYRNQTDDFEEVGATGPPVSPCLPPGMAATLAHVALARGDFFVLASDGFFEAPDAAGRRFGLERLRAGLHAARRCSARDIIVAIRQQVADFVGDAEQEDDMTMVVVRRT